MSKLDYDKLTEEERDELFWKDELRERKFKFSLRIFNWALEITAFPRVVIWKYDGGGGYPPIQWSWRSGFHRMKEPQRVSIQRVGTRLVPLDELQDDSVLDTEIIDA